MGLSLAADITRESNSSFTVSFPLLPKEQREALNTVYAFCRRTDDIVDEITDPGLRVVLLKKWREELGLALHGNSEYVLLNQLHVVAKKFKIPVGYFYELIEGVEMDLSKTRYETFDELKEYCKHVASSVGLMCVGIFGARNEKTKEYAANLGIAMQLTNIIRDVKEDAKQGRIYLPLEDLQRFNYSEKELLNNIYNENFISLMKFETQRAQEFYEQVKHSIPKEDKRTMFAAKIMERVYFHTLIRIKKFRYNVFERKYSLPKYLRVLIAMKYWVKLRLFG
ncbi:MAG: presqualene diphosphate synthase HpnD [Ignavibacteriales bacterium]|nr:presqualene diphosphate synthase HpnD [Ignavibacteriales bacterium]